MTGEEIEAIFDALERPFEPDEIKYREGDYKRRLAYIDAPTARKRLNQVLGRENWECDVTPYPNGVRCALTIRLPDGRSITRAALGGYPEMKKAEDAFKGGDSDAFKRAAAMFGVAAYLGDENHPGADRTAAASASPRGHRKERHEWPGAQAPAAGRGSGDGPPKTGKALFARIKEFEQEHGPGLLKYIDGWARLQEFPARMVDFTPGQVAEAYAEARRKLAEYQRSDQVQESLT